MWLSGFIVPDSLICRLMFSLVCSRYLTRRLANSDGIGVLTVPAGRFATVLHKGPYESIPAAYGLLFTWLAQQQIQPAGPPMEVYLSDPTETAEADLITEVRVPLT